MSDKQHVSIATLPNGQVWLVDYRQPEGQTHRLLRGANEHHEIRLDLGTIIAPAGCHDALKISRVTNAVISADCVVGGSEDVVDITASSNVVVTIERASIRGRYMSTIKGGCWNIELRVHNTEGRAKYVEHDIGNWFDYSHEKDRVIYIYSPMHPAPRVRVLNAERPRLSILHAWDLRMPWYRHLFIPAMKVAKKLGLA